MSGFSELWRLAEVEEISTRLVVNRFSQSRMLEVSNQENDIQVRKRSEALLSLFLETFPTSQVALQWMNATVKLEFLKKNLDGSVAFAFTIKMPLRSLLGIVQRDSFLYLAIKRQWPFVIESDAEAARRAFFRSEKFHFQPLHLSERVENSVELTLFKKEKRDGRDGLLNEAITLLFSQPFPCVLFSTDIGHSLVGLEPKPESGSCDRLFYHEYREISIDLTSVDSATESVVEAFIGEVRYRRAELAAIFSPGHENPFPYNELLRKKNNLGSESCTYIEFCKFAGVIF